MLNEPADPLGNDSQAIWMRNLKRWIKGYLVQDITGAKRKPQANGGVIYELPPAPPSTPPGAAVQDFQIVSDGGDYYNCNTFDGVTAGTAVVKVAKHQDLRCLLAGGVPSGGAWAAKTIRGITYSYAYNAVAGATADGVNIVEYTRDVVGDDDSSETDFVTPCLNVGDIITAVSTSFAGPASLSGVTWQAQADGRAWASPPPTPP